jgi:alpha-tubulin suppressor-like RCC1 family protein
MRRRILYRTALAAALGCLALTSSALSGTTVPAPAAAPPSGSPSSSGSFPHLDAVAIDAGYFHTCALTRSGAVFCWGENFLGQLGDGTTVERHTPVRVSGLNGGVVAIALGAHDSCALMRSGGVKCWGWNRSGQLGDGTTTDRLTPVDVVGLHSGVSAIAAGDEHTCAALRSGGTKCWGENSWGQLGDGTTQISFTPVDVSGLSSRVSGITAGSDHTCAVTSAGGAKCWGLNLFGELGDGTFDWRRLTPVDVSGLSTGVSAISAGDFHTCALTSVGGAKCWGADGNGQLGDGSVRYGQATPLDVVGLSSGVVAISGSEHTCAVTSAGGAKCWGTNHWGELGDGTTTQRLTPVDVYGLATGVRAPAAGLDHSCAVMSAGGVKCWGLNENGELGDGTTTNRLTPVDVVGFRP